MPDTSTHPLITSDRVQGTAVFGSDGREVGRIDHLAIDKASGRIAYAVMSFGGFLGLGEDFWPIPWAALRYDTGLGGYRTSITEEQLRGAPQHPSQDRDAWWSDRDWEERTYAYYGLPYYWL